jgi:hypothetical protein
MMSGTPRRRQSVPRPALRRRYADAPAAAFEAGLGAGEWTSAAAAVHMPFALLKAGGLRPLRAVTPDAFCSAVMQRHVRTALKGRLVPITAGKGVTRE